LISASPLKAKTWSYECTWTSTVDPNAKIVFHSVTGTNTTNGYIRYKGVNVINFSHYTTSGGYAQRYWYTGERSSDKDDKVKFMPNKSYLIIGLGSTLWYSGIRNNKSLLDAAEGTWVKGKKCG
tara:strand:- start:163 stop:534 length:372 start_codon:yes stop_codon:yes gene_type:complete